MNLGEMLDDGARYFPEHLAVIEGDRNITFSEFNRDANKMASAMVQSGLKPGDHVALCAPNSYAWLLSYYGAIKAGAIAVTFSYQLKKDELNKILADCQPRILLTMDEKLDDLGNLKNLPYPDLVLCDSGDIPVDAFLAKGESSFETVDCGKDDTAAILYTGGTTGAPKGAMLSHCNLKASIFKIAHYERCTPDDRALCFLPLNHVFGQVHIMNSTVYSCGATILQPAFNLEQALDAIQRYKITKFYAVPTIYIRMLALPDLKEKFKSIRYCFSAAASMAQEVVREWKEKTGLDIFESYGMTESAAMVTYNHYHCHKVGSVGTVVNNVEVQLRDDQGNPVGPGEEGEICILGPNITKGYLNNPEETKAAFWGEWYRSGDIGVFDDEGYLYIVDRLKDMIITGGENVYSREVEEVLYTMPEVSECAVVGLPDKEYGERVTAFIVPKEGEYVDPVLFKAYCKERLANYKVPKDFISVEALPKSSTGKLLKREIRNQYKG
jgi:long-chain acyl-CoA synthetase